MSLWVVVVLRYVKVSVRASTTVDRSPGPRPVIEPPPDVGNDTDEYDIVGESHYQSALLKLFGPKRGHGISENCAAVLIAEPDNRYDKNAVRCEISGLRVGYLSREDAKEFSEYMRRQNVRSIRVAAIVSGGWRDSKSEGYYGVRVEVPAELIDA